MIENADGTKEELERKKKDAIHYRNLKRNSNIFIFCACLAQIVITLIVLLALFILTCTVMFKIYHADQNESAYIVLQVLFISIFFVGLILGFFIYRRIADFVIRKFHFETKILASTISHYKIETKEEAAKRKKE